MDVLKHLGTMPCCKLKLKMSVKTMASWSAQCLIVAAEMLSGPAAFLQFWSLKSFFTSLEFTIKGVGGKGGVTATSEPG